MALTVVPTMQLNDCVICVKSEDNPLIDLQKNITGDETFAMLMRNIDYVSMTNGDRIYFGITSTCSL